MAKKKRTLRDVGMERLRKQVNALAQDNYTLKMQLDDHVALLKETRAEKNKHITQLQEQVAKQVSENASLKQQNDSLKMESATRLSEFKFANGKADKLRSEVDDLKEQLSKKATIIANYEKLVDEKCRTIAELKDVIVTALSGR